MADKFEAYTPGYLRLWKTSQTRAEWKSAARATANKVLKSRARYEAIQKATGVPWFWIGLTHQLEAGGRFDRHLHNGDRLTARTRLVPAGRPKTGSPPFTFEESAIDALTMKGLQKIKAWPIERLLYEAERYNGFGYRGRGKPNSPYLWSGANHYTRGKYIRDHVYSSSAVSQQVGFVIALRELIVLLPELAKLAKSAGGVADRPQEVSDTTHRDDRCTARDALRTGSRKFRAIDMLRWIFGFGTLGGASFWSVENLTGAGSYLTTFKSLMAEHGFVLLLIALVTGYFLSSAIRKWMIEDVVEGRSTPSGKV